MKKYCFLFLVKMIIMTIFIHIKVNRYSLFLFINNIYMKNRSPPNQFL